MAPQDGHQLKYYAPKIGNIEVGAVGGIDPEVLHMASHKPVSRAILARVNRLVIAEDLRGYRISKKVYRYTPRVKPMPPKRHSRHKHHHGHDD
jgi:hypothetical protein